MTETAHTPGPWYYKDSEIWADEECMNALVVGMNDQGGVIHEADGHLIAAAPDLLAVLEAERAGTPCGDGCVPGGWRKCSGCDDRIKTAIRKAKGGE